MKKEISNEDIQKAISNVDNINVANKAMSRYSKILQSDEIESCKINAIWRTLKSHDDCYGQKFTTSLFRFCLWECKKEVRKKKKKNNIEFVSIYRMSEDEIEAIDGLSNEHSRNFDEMIEILDNSEKIIMDKMYRQDKNVTEISKELGVSKVFIKKKINTCLQKIKEHYQLDE